MLHREDPEGLIVVSQPGHAWISGQLARAWGNDRFGTVEPSREVYVGAAQHDIAWLDWEMAPELNPDTGRPYSFRDMPTLKHVQLFAPAGKLALAYGRYVALLVSLHGTYLYKRFHDFERDSDAEERAAREFVRNGEQFEAGMIAELRRDPRYAELASDEIVARNRRLIATWDGMSLALCLGLSEQRTLGGIPTPSGDAEIRLTPLDDQGLTVEVDPWPFGVREVALVCEGRRLPDRFTDETAMRNALDAAPWVTLDFTLRPAG